MLKHILIALSSIFPSLENHLRIVALVDHAKKHNLKGLIIWPNSDDDGFRHHLFSEKI